MTFPTGWDNSPFESKASEYDAWFDGAGKLIFASEVEALRIVLSSLPNPWLEIGVGTGRFAQALGIKTGIDPAGKMLEIAKERGISVFQIQGEEQFFNKEIFGTVFLILTLCFVRFPLMILHEANRILKLDGKIVIGTILKDSPWGMYYQRKKEEGHYFYEHATFYSYEEMHQLLKESGFTIERVISTLFQKPGEVKEIEIPEEAYTADAGFNVIIAGKNSLLR